jgi:hypothetical protein
MYLDSVMMKGTLDDSENTIDSFEVIRESALACISMQLTTSLFWS